MTGTTTSPPVPEINDEPLRRGVVQLTPYLLDGTGPTLGLGFLIDEQGYILTCAHVLGQALFQDKRLQPSVFLEKLRAHQQAAKPIWVTFVWNKKRTVLEVDANENQLLAEKDLCLLKVRGRLPQDAVPLLLGRAQDANRADFAVLAPYESEGSDGARNVILATQGKTALLPAGQEVPERLRLYGSGLVEGCSGGPVWIPAQGRACGVLRQIQGVANGFAVPIEDFVHLLPHIGDVSEQSPRLPSLVILGSHSEVAQRNLHRQLLSIDANVRSLYVASIQPPCTEAVRAQIDQLCTRTDLDMLAQLAASPALTESCLLLLKKACWESARTTAWQALHAWSRLASESLRTGGSQRTQSSPWASLRTFLHELLKEAQPSFTPALAATLAPLLAESIGLLSERELSHPEPSLAEAINRVLEWTAQGRQRLGAAATGFAAAELSLADGNCYRLQKEFDKAIEAFRQTVQSLFPDAAADQDLPARRGLVAAGQGTALGELAIRVMECTTKVEQRPDLFEALGTRLPHHVAMLALEVGQRLLEGHELEPAQQLVTAAQGLFESIRALRGCGDASLLLGTIGLLRSALAPAIAAHKTDARRAFSTALAYYRKNEYAYGKALADRELLLLDLQEYPPRQTSAQNRAKADFVALIEQFDQVLGDRIAAASTRVSFADFLLSYARLAEPGPRKDCLSDSAAQLELARQCYQLEDRDPKILAVIAELLMAVYAEQERYEETVKEYGVWCALPPDASGDQSKGAVCGLYVMAKRKLAERRLDTGTTEPSQREAEARQALSDLRDALDAAQSAPKSGSRAEMDRLVMLIGTILLDRLGAVELARPLISADGAEIARQLSAFLNGGASN